MLYVIKQDVQDDMENPKSPDGGPNTVIQGAN